MNVTTLAAELAATARKLHTALQNDNIPVADMVAALADLGDAGQYLGGALRAIAQAATAEHAATGLGVFDSLADEVYAAADDLVCGGLYVEENVVPVADDALLVFAAEQAAQVTRG